MMKSVFRRSRTSLAAGGLLLVGAVLTQGCLQREVKKQNPNTSNVFVEKIIDASINEIDLLFVVDNSVSMADKQEILRDAVPNMVERLVNPLCVDDAGVKTPNPGECPAGSAEEFNPVDDIHIGVITSSLGAHGATPLCARTEAGYNNDDQGRLLPSVRAGLPDPTGQGFLAWTGGDAAAVAALTADFEEHVAAAGEVGCGFEATLESWYRFLVDPQPPLEMVIDPATDRAVMATDAAGVPLKDETLLAQREAFLRPEGLVAIIILSDENDCSAMDGGEYYDNAGYGYLVAQASFDMPVATAMCATNPNDKCCFSCLQGVPDGCESEGAICDAGNTIPPEEDRANVRCYQSKRRFGVDLMYPTQRYVDALTKPEIVDARTGEVVENPLLRGAGESNKGKPRDPDLVFLAGIVGLPWQDIATDESLTDPNVMAYRTAAELNIANVEVGGSAPVNRWEVILGSPGLAASTKVCDTDAPGCGDAPIAPYDPFMIESIAPRTAGAANPISGDVIVDFNSDDPFANAINGHEANHQVVDSVTYSLPGDSGVANDDLQYACIFPLSTPKEDCTAAQANCDCGDEPSRNRPLCQPPGGGAAVTTQYFGKAYPGTRILQVLRDFGANSIVGSICPKITDPTNTSGYGYNPAVQAIVDRLAEKLAGKCLPRELTLDETGDVPCEVVEAKPPNEGEPLNCGAPGRTEVADAIQESVRKQLAAGGHCDGGSDIRCEDYQMCSITQVTNTDDCFFNEGDPASFPDVGFCYIDPAKGPNSGGVGADCNADDEASWGSCTNPIVKNCPATERRLLRFTGDNTPVADSITFVACTADAASADAPIPRPPEAMEPVEETME